MLNGSQHLSGIEYAIAKKQISYLCLIAESPIFAASDTKGYSTRHIGVGLGCPLLFSDTIVKLLNFNAQ